LRLITGFLFGITATDFPTYAAIAAGLLVMAIAAVPLVYWIRFHVYPLYIPGGEPPDPLRYAAATPVVAVTVVAVFAFMDVYR